MRLHFLAWESQETVTICEGDYKQLEPAVYHSTGFLQSHNSHKISQNAMQLVMSISWKPN